MHHNFPRRLGADPWFLAGAALAVLFALLMAAMPWLTPHDPHDMSFQPFAPVSSAHWLGVNDGGMDIFSELLYGIRNTLAFGLAAGTAGLVIGTGAGLVSAWFRGFADLLLMRISEVLMAIPAVMILILVAAFFRPPPMVLALVLAVMSWPPIAKVIRAQTLVLKNSTHIHAARQMGASGSYIIWRHLLPELFPLYLIGFASRLRMAIFMEASLAFLGLFDPGRKSLGIMINHAIGYYYLDIWSNWLIPPIFCLSLLIMCVTFLAISLEKIFDPRLKETL